MSYQYAKFEENPCMGTDESTPLTYCTIILFTAVFNTKQW